MGGNAVKVMLILLVEVCHTEVTLVKTIGREPDVTPVCLNKTLDIILLTVCNVPKKRIRGRECHLAYLQGQDFDQGCDSRIKLIKKDQTLFLHLTNLTSVDSGNYTCDCVYLGGSDTLHLSITVEEDEEAGTSSITAIATAVIGVAAFIIVTGVIIGFILRRIHHGKNTRPEASELPEYANHWSLDQDDQDPYTSLQHPASDLYQTVSSVHRLHDAAANPASSSEMIGHLDNQGPDGRETDSHPHSRTSCQIYENA
ncbi:uncharacterized protein [Centroberyx affinis]|uniref:uncharacterized protein n=1 Tax=Centroberyx affinis TaxID=166261 RepID=UPI003A5C2F29